MSGESPKKTGRGYARNLDIGSFQPMVYSWDLHLRAERKSAKTVRTYLDAAWWFAAGYLIPAGLGDWDEVKAKHVQEWIITLLGGYSDCYANNQFRAAAVLQVARYRGPRRAAHQPDGSTQAAEGRRQDPETRSPSSGVR
jgi:hypothetical protein